MAQKKPLPTLFGVLGYPAKHSLSPRMHNAAFKALKINARYRIFEVEPSRLKAFFASLSRRGIAGLNVTIPYKQSVFPFLRSVTEEAAMIGAVNTIKVSANGLRGYNTDGEGFLRHLIDDLSFDPRNRNIAVLGAGGASRAVCVYLCKAKPRSIAIFNRDRSKTIDLVHLLNMHNTGIEFIAADTVAHLGLEKADLLVNTTSVGMNETDPSLVDPSYLRPGMLVYDLVYSRKSTRLLGDAGNKGCRTANGLGMLLYQGMAAFKIWTGRTPPKKIMARSLGL
ncbi:MAG TPA: shikimate dehydrogenase [Candidatus Omnitrophota bacterium]|nr:shikimate dehydrogenase [Candidatus Omnitrophota bacterium]HQJ15910.1 shikimate dehydrogenase [Candidatus Omnitrophota bacterium]